MGVREGGSYVADTKGEPRLVERTTQEDAHRLDPEATSPEVPTLPAAPIPETAPAETSGSPRRRAGSDAQTQE